MNAPKVIDSHYIQFLIASPGMVSGTEAARVHPESGAEVDLPRWQGHRVSGDQAA